MGSKKASATMVRLTLGQGGQETKPDVTTHKEEHPHQVQQCPEIFQKVLHHGCSRACLRPPCTMPITVTMISVTAMPMATRLTVVATCAARQASSARWVPPALAGGTIWVCASQVAIVPFW